LYSSRISSLISQTKVLSETHRFKKWAQALCPTSLNPATPANSTEVSTTPLARRRDLVLVVAVLVLASNSWAQERPPILEKIAKTYGLDSWNQIEAIRYTWPVEYGTFNLSRSWEWEPKTTQVTYEGKDKDGKPVKVTYKRSELSSQPDNVKNDVDPGFTNDNYTLLFPLKAYWDSSPSVIDQGMFNLPSAAARQSWSR
jgi:hypothetical protein